MAPPLKTVSVAFHVCQCNSDALVQSVRSLTHADEDGEAASKCRRNGNQKRPF